MNLWRIAVDQATGRAQGAPEPVTNGVQASVALPRFSKDGSRVVFQVARRFGQPRCDPVRSGHPARGRAGRARHAEQHPHPERRVSRRQAGGVFQHRGGSGGHLCRPAGWPDAPHHRRPAADRAPVFTPDGRSLVFYSNRDGYWGVWTVGIDGGGLRKITGPEASVMYPQVSPKGDALIFAQVSAALGLFSVPLNGGSPTPLPGSIIDGKSFMQSAWSPNGSRLAGVLRSDNGRPSGLGVYDLAAGAMTIVGDDETSGVRWLSDSRRLVYFATGGRELVVLDTVSRQRTVVDVRLPAPSTDEVFALSPDNRSIYYGAARAEADIGSLSNGDCCREGHRQRREGDAPRHAGAPPPAPSRSRARKATTSTSWRRPASPNFPKSKWATRLPRATTRTSCCA